MLLSKEMTWVEFIVVDTSCQPVGFCQIGVAVLTIFHLFGSNFSISKNFALSHFLLYFYNPRMSIALIGRLTSLPGKRKSVNKNKLLYSYNTKIYAGGIFSSNMPGNT